MLRSHEVGGTRYLRADYSLVCGTSEWLSYAAYSSVWVACYVIGFPACVLWKLGTYRQNPGQDGQMLGFLMDDFKLAMPMLCWEGVEMIRKLLLSVLGAFWSTKSTMCIATALLISSTFLVAHFHLSPYRSTALNRLQSLALTVLTLLYFIGLLLKTESVEESDREDLGVLMVLLVATTLVTTVAMVISEVIAVMRWTWEINYAIAAVKQDPMYNPALEGHIITGPRGPYY
jgi:hypothetical protein